MAKQKVTFSCSDCNYRPVKWVGCCPECNNWGTIQEVTTHRPNSKARSIALHSLKDVDLNQQPRMLSDFSEWDRVVGNGIMPGSFLILTGDPGIGKSTLLLQIANQLSNSYSCFYISSEESLAQIKQRAQRLGCDNQQLLFSDQAHLESIIELCEQQKPQILIVDSIQNCFSSKGSSNPGSVTQLKEAAFSFMRLAKEFNIAIILTGHITKEGHIAGPKLLEHMVDGVFYLQGEDRWQTRVLRSVKNRFGPINELGFFEMQESGLTEVQNINEQLLNEATFSPGSALISYIEGSKPLLIELQALIVPSKFGIPQRVISGINQKQVVIIAAILEKYLQIKLSSYDIFFKVSGGFTIKESSADLGIALALLSSYFQKPLPEKSLVLGELNLTGQIKPVNQLSIHLKEAEKFGLKKIIVAAQQKTDRDQPITSIQSVYDLLRFFDD